jgi:hypothetical protein
MFSSDLDHLSGYVDDISTILVERAKNGVSLDSASSKRGLSSSCALPQHNTMVAQLSLMYDWLGRIDKSNFEDSYVFDSIAKSVSSSNQVPCGPLTAFVNDQRKKALEMCGWSDLSSPSIDAAIVGGCFTLASLTSEIPIPVIRDALSAGDVERGAALALLHGLVEVAGQILTFAAVDARQPELLQLTAMAIAGCPGPQSTRSSEYADRKVSHLESGRRVWLKSVHSLSARIDEVHHPYLKVSRSRGKTTMKG